MIIIIIRGKSNSFNRRLELAYARDWTTMGKKGWLASRSLYSDAAISFSFMILVRKEILLSLKILIFFFIFIEHITTTKGVLITLLLLLTPICLNYFLRYFAFLK
jgi:hypothetical protein